MQADTDYNGYDMPAREIIRTMAVSGGLIGLLSLLFYNSLWPLPVLLIQVFMLLMKRRRDALIRKRKALLTRQFLAAGTLLGDYLKSGYSVENAVIRSTGELQEVWGEDADIVREWKEMAAGMRLNRPVEEVFSAFAERSGIEQIRDFSEIFHMVKRGGGQLGITVSAVTALLTEQFRVEDQIRTMIAAKRYEQKIMDLMPAAILLYIRISSPDLLTVLYTTIAGRIIMTVCLLLYGAAVWWAERIIDIRM